MPFASASDAESHQPNIRIITSVIESLIQSNSGSTSTTFVNYKLLKLLANKAAMDFTFKNQKQLLHAASTFKKIHFSYIHNIVYLNFFRYVSLAFLELLITQTGTVTLPCNHFAMLFISNHTIFF